MDKHTYTSGEFASLFNLNKKTLEYYRKIGLFSPQIVDSNGYSKYSHHQIDSLYTILSLKKLNLSLNEIKSYVTNRSPEFLMELLEEKIIVANKQLYEINKVKNYLQETITYTKTALQYKEQLTINFEEKEYLLVATPKNNSNIKKYQVEFEEATFSPNTSCIGTIVSLGDSSDSPQIFMKLYKDKKMSNRVKKSGLYACNIHVGTHESIHSTYEKMKIEIALQGYTLGNTAYEQYLIDDLATYDKEQYVTLIKMEVFDK